MVWGIMVLRRVAAAARTWGQTTTVSNERLRVGRGCVKDAPTSPQPRPSKIP